MDFVATVETEFPQSIESPTAGLASDRSCAERREFSQSHWARELSLKQPVGFSDVPLAARRQALKRNGDFTLAYSTAVQPLLRHFGDENGYIAFRKRLGVTVVLGDPVASLADRTALIENFVQQYRHPVFCQVSEATARVLQGLGYFANEIGVDSVIDLPSYSFAGREKEWLRYAANWTHRKGYRIFESDAEQDLINVDRVEAVSEAWRQTKTVKRKEIRFLNRPIVLEPEPDVRRFFLADANGQIQAFVFLDPLYRDGKIVGYVTSIKRRHPDAPPYAEQAIMKKVIEDLQSDNLATLRLGLSPFAWIEDREFSHSQLLGRLLRWAHRSSYVNRNAYNLRGHSEYKRRFRCREEKFYFASTKRFSVRSLLAVIGLCGVA
jgi:lysylphosphatidylglycerol synthetase-like protein (DUF2156 family)